jgi:hypothetical protein
MHFNEQCIMYDGKNKGYQERKERVYVSLSPQDITDQHEKISKLIDLNYLTKKPKELLENKQAGSRATRMGQASGRVAHGRCSRTGCGLGSHRPERFCDSTSLTME